MLNEDKDWLDEKEFFFDLALSALGGMVSSNRKHGTLSWRRLDCRVAWD